MTSHVCPRDQFCVLIKKTVLRVLSSLHKFSLGRGEGFPHHEQPAYLLQHRQGCGGYHATQLAREAQGTAEGGIVRFGTMQSIGILYCAK